MADIILFDRQGAVTNQAVGAASAGTTLPAGEYLCIVSTTNAYLALGYGGAVTATNANLIVPANYPIILRVPSQATHFAVLQVSAGGTISLFTVHDE